MDFPRHSGHVEKRSTCPLCRGKSTRSRGRECGSSKKRGFRLDDHSQTSLERITSTAPHVAVSMKAAGRSFDHKIYAGVGHTFFNDIGERDWVSFSRARRRRHPDAKCSSGPESGPRMESEGWFSRGAARHRLCQVHSSSTCAQTRTYLLK
jgi:hypothetical protein